MKCPILRPLLCVAFSACGTFPIHSVPDASIFDAGTLMPPRDGGVIALTDAGLPKELACSVLIEKRCEYLLRCKLIPTEGVADCRSALEKNWCGPATWPSRLSAVPPTLRYDGIRALACAQAFESLSCEEFIEEPLSCKNFLLPNVGLGQSCFDGYNECIEGVCRGAVCPKTCQPRGQQNEICSQSKDCLASLYCRTSSTSVGVGRCSAYISENAVCDEFALCADGLSCVRNSCVKLPTSSLPCFSGLCDPTAQCSASADGGLICSPKAGADAGCRSSQDCLPSLTCTINGCQPLQLATTGSLCVEGQRCPVGNTCIRTVVAAQGVCAPFLALGESCENSNECLDQLSCQVIDAGTRVCAPRSAAQAPCTTARDCQLAHTCLGGFCQALPALGQACNATKQCRSGNCVRNTITDAGLVCEALFGAGKDCQLDAECASKRCVQNRCLAACVP
jgi:hypothetical protein